MRAGVIQHADSCAGKKVIGLKYLHARITHPIELERLSICHILSLLDWYSDGHGSKTLRTPKDQLQIA